MSTDHIAMVADMFRLLGDPTRLRIILTCLDEPRAVGEIAEATGASPSLVSHHLRLLKAARLVRADRQARHVYYIAADDHIRHMLHDMMDHAAEDDLPKTPAA